MKKKRCSGGSGCSAVKNRQPRDFRYDCENSLGLRKFRSHSENFAILAKLRNFARLAKLRNFARLAKFHYVAKITVPSEILQFLYL